MDSTTSISKMIAKPLLNTDDTAVSLTVVHEELEKFYKQLEKLLKERGRPCCVYYKTAHGLKSPVSVALNEIKRSLSCSSSHTKRLILIQAHIGMHLECKQKSLILCSLKEVTASFGYCIKYPVLNNDYELFSHASHCPTVSQSITYVGVRI